MLNYQATNDPLLLLLGNGAGADSFDMLGPRLGWRVRRAPLDAGSAGMVEAVSARCLVVELDALADAAADAVLAEVEAHVTAGRGAAVVAFPREAIDRVAAAIRSPEVQLLCDADMAERAAALATAHGGAATLRDTVGEAEAERLQRLTEEVGRIARTLADLSRGQMDIRPRIDGDPPPADMDDIDPAVVRGMIRLRRLRDQYFDGALFADPAWDMLLDLTAARAEGRSVAVSSLCIAAAVPPTTALRWISTMTEAGLLVRRSDPLDRRRMFMTLSEGAAAAMATYLRAATKLGVSLAA